MKGRIEEVVGRVRRSSQLCLGSSSTAAPASWPRGPASGAPCADRGCRIPGSGYNSMTIVPRAISQVSTVRQASGSRSCHPFRAARGTSTYRSSLLDTASTTRAKSVGDVGAQRAIPGWSWRGAKATGSSLTCQPMLPLRRSRRVYPGRLLEAAEIAGSRVPGLEAHSSLPRRRSD